MVLWIVLMGLRIVLKGLWIVFETVVLLLLKASERHKNIECT